MIECNLLSVDTQMAHSYNALTYIPIHVTAIPIRAAD